MASLKPKFRSIKAFGTDDEANLYNVFKDEHANSRNLLCFVHFKNNVKDHLYKIGADEANMRLILSDLFGEQIGTRLDVLMYFEQHLPNLSELTANGIHKNHVT